jgi:hypothetical protein
MSQRSEDRTLIGCVIFVVLMLSGLVVQSVHGEGYVPLTIDQAKAWMELVGPDAVAADIVRLDWIEHSAPVVNVPPFLAVLTGRDLSWNWQGPLIVEVAPIVSTDKPPIHYEITLTGGSQKDFAPPSKEGDVLIWQIIAALGTVGGVFLGHALK